MKKLVLGITRKKTDMTILKAMRAASMVLALCLCSALSARAETITFDSLAQPGTGFSNVGLSYTESGFTFTNSGSVTNAGFRSPQTGNPSYTGTGTLAPIGSFTLRAADNSPFNFTSLDMSQLSRTLPIPVSASFTGSIQGGGVVNRQITFGGVFGLFTFTFTDFTNLSELLIFGIDIQIDNVNVSRVTPTTPVPEPAAMILLGTGLAGIAAKVRRRRSK